MPPGGRRLQPVRQDPPPLDCHDDAAGSTVTVTMSLLAINVVTVHWAREMGGRHRQQRRDGGQGAYACDFLEVAISGGQHQQRR
jgi:hypothetical protein